MAGRRFTLYFSWERESETDVELGVLDNRYPTLFELRRAVWPHLEHLMPPEHSQGIDGFLNEIVLGDFEEFRKVVSDKTGEEVNIVERHSSSGLNSLTEVLPNVDTLLVISLDHFRTEQRPTDEEVVALTDFISMEGKCLVVCPHHDVGAEASDESKRVELEHHGDRLVPSQQRIGGFATNLLARLNLEVAHQYGLSPGVDVVNGGPARLRVFSEEDGRGVLRGVETFNLHPHLPHLTVLVGDEDEFRVLAKQKIRPDASAHPFTEAGNSEFNAFLWAPPNADRKADVFVCDATLWSSAFGGLSNLRKLWANLAEL